jgi:hypothetical protein
MTQYIKKLPAVFQTVTEKKFFDATFDQVFSKKDSDLLAGYLGRRDPGSYNPITDFYLPEPSKNRTWWQLEATAYARDADTTKSNVFFYEDLLENIEYYGGNTLNQDRLFESEYYSFGPPIDYDMFINYQNYYWVEQGLPVISITGVLASDIIGQSSYTTPITATPPNLTLTSGMTIALLDDPTFSDPHVLENFGGCIGFDLIEKFTDLTAGTIFEFLPWDGTIELSTGRIIENEFWDMNTWEVQAQPGNGDYITIERGAIDRNAWSRTNKWFHIETINASIAATGSSFPTNATRALRPIIQFVANIPLYKSGTQFRETISFGFGTDLAAQPLTLAQFQGQPLATINLTYNIEMADLDLVCWFDDPLSNGYIYEANVDGFGIVTFTEWTSVVTPALNGDIVFVAEDGPYNSAQRGQTWYYEAGVWQEAYNEKISTNQPPLFVLLDHNGVELDDPVTYPDSTFRGSEIFSYKVNTTAGATVDPVLKFPIVYTSLGQATDIVFQNDLITNRYTYNGNVLTPIDGYYYYNITTSEVTFNNWNLYDVCGCDDGINPNFEKFSATAAQTVFNTNIPTVANAAGKTYLQVFVNGVYQQEGVTKNYQVTGASQITFNVGVPLSSDVVIYDYSAVTDIPDYEEFVSLAAQTVFNTAIPTVATQIQVYVNGVFQVEGLTKNFTVTGANQITFNTGLALNSDVVIVGYSTVTTPPSYASLVATSSQTVFTTLFPVLAGTTENSYLQVFVNGVYQLEGATKNFTVTGPNQITFNTGLILNSDVVIFGEDAIAAGACPNYSKQRVIDKYVVGYGSEFNFRLSVTPYGYILGGGAIQTDADISVNVNGTEIKNEIGGFEFFELNNRIYIDLTAYLTNLLTTTQTIPPVVEAQTYTRGLLDPAYPGYFEIPQQLEANPTQLEVSEISASNLIQHFASIIENQVGFTGSSFGGINNYRDSLKNRSVGLYILQNLAPALKSMLVSSSDDLDFIKGVRFSSDEYTKFKNKFLTTALQLINQGFDPVQVFTGTVDIAAWVGEILRILNVSKEFSNAFAYSFMAAQGTPFASETFNVPGNTLITLANYVDLTDPRNVVYLYDVTNPTTERILTVGVDYEIVNTNLAIDIQLNLGVGVKDILVYLYKNPLPTYIPSTPTKVGAWGAYIPRIELDATYAIPTDVVIGHDGSKTISYGDYRDQLLLDLETRIYNFLQTKYRNEYYIPLRIESVKTGYFRQTRYSRDEYLEITESYLNKWSAKNRANYRVNDWPTASLTTPLNQLWKLYNYRLAVTPTGGQTDLPGNWKGIFQYYYDTYYPDTRPWEMLGFSTKPEWWETEYGPPVLNLAGQEVWTSTSAGLHIMYTDLEAGIIRQGPCAIYNPDTQIVQPQEMWVRPGLSSLIPVDGAGEIIPIITLFGLAYSGNPYAPFDHFDDAWVYGDGSPVEQAWMSTSAYAYSAQEFLYLMRPGPFGELLWDTLGTELSPGMITVPASATPVMSNKNWQYVQNDIFAFDDPFFAWFRPKNKDQYVHAEIVDSVTEVRFGYQCWISDRILFLGKNIADTFGQKIRTLDVNLANKVAGFINKDTTNTYISSVSPGANTNTLIIPSTNFDVFLHKSPVVDTYSYSGVIVRALADGTFVVYGYDLFNAEFITLDRANEKTVEVSVGGTPAEFRYFEVGATYNQGEIVRYNGVYYESLATQTVSKFIATDWQKLKGLPTEGGITVTYKPISLETTTKYPYGSILKNAQEVFDLMIGWGAYLEKQGWQFTEVNQDTNILNDWLSSAKQFLFWLNTNWAPDASIQLSPLANTATLIVKRGYPNDVESLSNGVYSILDKFGVAIAPNNTSTDREGPMISVAPTDLSTGGIFFIQINAAETEHILIFDNVTNFSDVLYDPLLRARQQRLRFNGFRSNGWYGKMEAPGYLIIDDQLVPNYDTIVESMRYFYDPNVTIDNPSLEDLGRHLIGYESKGYLDNLSVSNDVQYLFYQGAIRQKGTKQAFEKLFRSTKVQSNEIIKVYEEWALKLGDFGNTIEQVSTEFRLIPEQNTGEVIVARLNFVPSTIGFVRQINILNAENTYINIPKLVFPLPDAEPDVAWSDFSSELTYQVGNVVKYPDQFGNPVYYSSNVLQITVRAATTANIVLAGPQVIDGVAVVVGDRVLVKNQTTQSQNGIYVVRAGAWTRSLYADTSLELTGLTAFVQEGLLGTDTTWVQTTQPPITIGVTPIGWTQSSTAFIAANWTVVLATRICRAYVVLDSTNRISRVDITDPGIGYLEAPLVSIDSGAEPHNLDKLYSVWQGEIISDPTLDNIVNIDIDETDVWVVRPTDPSVALEFPLTNIIDYPIPNAGYVNFNDVDFSVFDVTQTIALWGSVALNPGMFDTIWVAKTFTEDWCVYKLMNIMPAPMDPLTWKVVTDEAGNLLLLTNYSLVPADNVTIVPQLWTEAIGSNRNDFGNLLVLQQVTDNVIIGDNNQTVGFIPYSTEDYAVPGLYLNPTDLVNYNAYSLVTVDGNPIAATDMANYEDLNTLLLFKIMRWHNVPAEPYLPTYVGIGDNIWIDDVDEKWTVFNIQADPGFWDIAIWDPEIIDFWSPNYGWDVTGPLYLNPFRVQEPLINTHLFESASVFNTAGTELVQLPIYDPFKFILPGPAKQNLKYLSLQDPARYNVSGDTRLFSENITFGVAQVGQLWWDLSSTRFVYYEQPIALDGSETEVDNLVYRRDRWAQIFPGSTIDIYEWVQSDVPPEQYTGTGVPRDVTSYVQLETSNRFTSVTEIKYYFWVLGATDLPNVENRTLPALEVGRLLQSPKRQGFAFFSPVQQTATNNSYMFYNVQEILAYQGDNIQVQYRISERDDQEHAQWAFFREGDPNSLVTDQFWNKMVDSLCGYTKVLPVTGEFSDGIVVANFLPWDIYGWDVAPWDDATPLTSPEYGEILPVPDPTLSESEKYGITYRPRQGMFVKLYSARKIFVQAGNELLKHIPIRDNNPSWNADVATDDYWTYTNWYELGYEDAVPTVVYQTLADANIALVAGQLTKGTILQVVDGTIDGRYVLYAVVQLNPNVPTLSLNEVAIENSAIKLLDTIFTSRNKYGLSVELRELLNAFRTQVMIDAYVVDQNELFFSLLNYVVSEQKNPNWVFKSSYIFIKEDNLPLTQDQLFIPDQIGNIIDYITDVKPYHTQIRDYSSTYYTTDIAPGTASDFFKWVIKLQFGPSGAEDIDPYANSPAFDPMIGWDFHQGPYSIPWDFLAQFVGASSSGNVITISDTTGLYAGMRVAVTGGIGILDSMTFIVAVNSLTTFTVATIPLVNPPVLVPLVGASLDITMPWDITNISLIINQYISRNAVTPTYNPGFSPWPGFDENTIQVPLTFFDATKVGYSQLFPYTFDFNSINLDNPQTFITPYNIVAVKADSDTLYYGQDYYVEYNEIDENYTIYFFNDPGIYTILAVFVWLDGGPIQNSFINGYRNELAAGTATDDLVINVDTKLPVDISTGIPTPYVLYGDVWDTVPDPVAQILIDAGGDDSVPWDATLVLELFPNTISSRENTNAYDGANFTRNAFEYAGDLAIDLPAPSLLQDNIDVITVTAAADILPNPGELPGVIWINGERIEYKDKQIIAINTWELRLVRRGTMGTAPAEHLALVPEVDEVNTGPGGQTILVDPPVYVPNKVWIEKFNYIPGLPNEEVWNVDTLPGIPDLSTIQAPSVYTSVTNVPVGGLWYSYTPEANFLKSKEGKSIP